MSFKKIVNDKYVVSRTQRPKSIRFVLILLVITGQ